MSTTNAATEGIVSVGTAKMIGFLLAICGNTLIACSLTLQKSAHNALTSLTSSISSDTSAAVEKCPDDHLPQLTTSDDDDEQRHLPTTTTSTESHENSSFMKHHPETQLQLPPSAATIDIESHYTQQHHQPYSQYQQQQQQQHPSPVSTSFDMFTTSSNNKHTAPPPPPLPPQSSITTTTTSSNTTNTSSSPGVIVRPPSPLSSQTPINSSSSASNSTSSSITCSTSGIAINSGTTTPSSPSSIHASQSSSSSPSTHTDSGLAFLKNPTWWIGTFLMAAGEIGNFAAFAFAPASLVAPLGAWSVVLSAILAHVFLHESVSNINVIGIALCVTGAFLIGTSGPDVSAAEAALDAASVSRLLIRIPFVIFILLTVSATAALIYLSHHTSLGQRYIFVYVGVSSLLGAVTVVCAKALSTFLRLTLEGNSQFGNWLPFALGIILACAILAQLRYLNMAMSQFGNAQVIPVYYVLFTSCAMTSGVIMYREFDELTVRNLPFFVGICSTMSGVFLVSKSARSTAIASASSTTNNVHHTHHHHHHTHHHVSTSAAGNSSSTAAAAALNTLHESGFRTSKRSRASSQTARYERVLPVSPMSSPRSGLQQSMWA